MRKTFRCFSTLYSLKSPNSRVSFWQKTFIRIEGYKSKTFSCKDLGDETLGLGKRIYEKYAELDSIELWNDEVLTSVLKQIQYAHEANYLSSTEDTVILLTRLKQLVQHIQDMAEVGRKFLPNNTLAGGGNFDLYHNDVILGDNSIILETPEHSRMYISQNIIQGLITSDQRFVDNTLRIKTNLFKNSLLLSKSAEKERVKFFGTLNKKIDQVGKTLQIAI